MVEPIKILVVDDEPADLLLVGRVLKESSRGTFRPLQASSLDEAELTLRVSTVALVVVDLNLGGTYGAQTIALARTRFGALPIVALTAESDERLGEACIDAGADDFLAKERMIDDLDRVITFALYRRRLFRRSAKAVFDSFVADLPAQAPQRDRVHELLEQHREQVVDAVLDPGRRTVALRKSRALAERLIDTGVDPAALFREVVSTESHREEFVHAFVDTLAVNLASALYGRAKTGS